MPGHISRRMHDVAVAAVSVGKGAQCCRVWQCMLCLGEGTRIFDVDIIIYVLVLSVNCKLQIEMLFSNVIALVTIQWHVINRRPKYELNK